ncbi:MAG: TetR/AcrR family transcriptional regulator [Halieaceae bacterium]|nr:TetR/AcrR family transcriptional regulator [Halieaceae bacterium]
MKTAARSSNTAETPPATGRAAASKLERTRQKLVAGIRAEVADAGNFNADRVAARAGTSPATFYNHFATKDDALVAAYEALMAELADSVAADCRIERLLDQGLDDFALNWLQSSAAFFADNAALFRLAQAAIERSRELRELFRRYEDSIIGTYRRFIELGQAANLIRQGDALAMAQTLAVVSEGWFHPLVQKLEPGSPLHREMAGSLARALSPDGGT